MYLFSEFFFFSSSFPKLISFIFIANLLEKFNGASYFNKWRRRKKTSRKEKRLEDELKRIDWSVCRTSTWKSVRNSKLILIIISACIRVSQLYRQWLHENRNRNDRNRGLTLTAHQAHSISIRKTCDVYLIYCRCTDGCWLPFGFRWMEVAFAFEIDTETK